VGTVVVARTRGGIGVVDRSIVVVKVPAVYVVDVAVPVVVDTVPGRLTWIGPDVVSKVGVVYVHPFFYNGDDCV
jgi:hypothetical protein